MDLGYSNIVGNAAGKCIEKEGCAQPLREDKSAVSNGEKISKSHSIGEQGKCEIGEEGGRA